MYSSADGRKQGGCNEYLYNKELAPHIVKWLEKAGHEAVLCIAPEGKLHSLNEEIDYFIGEEHKDNYDLSAKNWPLSGQIVVLRLKQVCTGRARPRRKPC